MEHQSHRGKISTAWKFSSGIMMIAHHESQVLIDSEYDEVLEAYQKYLNFPIRGIIFSSKGGRPNAGQRERATNFWINSGVKPPPMVLMTTSSIARGALTAINWFMNIKLKAVAFEDYSEAFMILNVTNPILQTHIQGSIKQLHNSLAFS